MGCSILSVYQYLYYSGKTLARFLHQEPTILISAVLREDDGKLQPMRHIIATFHVIAFAICTCNGTTLRMEDGQLIKNDVALRCVRRIEGQLGKGCRRRRQISQTCNSFWNDWGLVLLCFAIFEYDNPNSQFVVIDQLFLSSLQRGNSPIIITTYFSKKHERNKEIRRISMVKLRLFAVITYVNKPVTNHQKIISVHDTGNCHTYRIPKISEILYFNTSQFCLVLAQFFLLRCEIATPRQQLRTGKYCWLNRWEGVLCVDVCASR